MPAITMTVGEQSHRTRSQSNRWRQNAVWQNETFVFEVGSHPVDLTATCINVSGEGLRTIGAANVKLAPSASGTSVQQMSLLRRSRTGHLVLAGTLHIQITFFEVGKRPRRGPSLVPEEEKKTTPKTPSIASLSVVMELEKSKAAFGLPSPGSHRRASFPVTRADYACLQLNEPPKYSLIKSGHWFHVMAKNGISRITTMTRLTMAVGLAVLMVLILPWLFAGAPPVVSAPVNGASVSSSARGKASSMKRLFAWGGRTDEEREAARRYVADVLTSGSI
eukprot:jgi/Undpi1/9081/HiC_scaffold_26.g11541.m1